jgi:small ubiquitin-related modifier
MMAFVDEYATALLAGAVTIIAVLCGKLYDYKTRLDAAEAKAGDYDALNRRLTEAKSLYYQRERTVAMAQKELVESARKRKAAEAKAEKLLQERDAARELSKDFAATTRVVAAMENTTARMSRELEEAARNQKKAEETMKKLREERDGTVHMLEIENMHKSRELEQAESAIAINDVTIEEYKEALKIAAAGEVEKMRDELECMREELEEAKRDRELAINFAGGAADDVAKAAAEEAEALREKAAAARERAAQTRVATQLNVRHPDSLNIRVRDPTTGEETFFKIKKTTKMHKIFHAYCTRKGQPVTAFRFLFDGQRVDGEQTAEDIDMEDGDQIDALNELLHVTIKFAPSDSPRSIMIPATSTVADLRTALGIGAGPRFVWMGRLLDDDTKSLVEYGVENGQAIIVQGRPSPADLSD